MDRVFNEVEIVAAFNPHGRSKIPAMLSVADLSKQISERDHQRTVIQFLEARRVLFCHVPNGGSRNPIEAANLKRDGVKPGVPDILIFSGPPKNPEIRGVALEMKKIGGKVSTHQAEWIDRLTAESWHCIVAHGADDAIAELKRLGF